MAGEGGSDQLVRENIYEMYVRNGNKAGFWVVRDSWSDCVAIIRTVDRKQAGALTGAPPYYGNPPVRGGLWDWKLKRWRQKYFDVTSPGTYAYRRLPKSSQETTPTDTGIGASADAVAPEGPERSEGGERSDLCEGGGGRYPPARVGVAGREA